jgi:glycosyltransferase involved in cell wall biosynthesis
METAPEVSIIIPFYNRGKLLLRALRSVFLQTFTDYEIIVVDDGSEEDYYPVMEALQLKNLSYFKLPHQNANVARNYGIKKSKGKYIAMLDSDDEWMKHHLESNIRIMQRQDCDGIYSSVVSKGLNGARIFQVRRLYDDEKMVNYLLSTNIGAQTSTLFIEAGAAKKILWDESLYRHQDYDFVIRFNKEFKWSVNLDVTSIYHSESNPGRVVDFNSCIRFIEMNKNDILPEIYTAYHKRMLNYAIALRSEKHIIDYYAQNSVWGVSPRGSE